MRKTLVIVAILTLVQFLCADIESFEGLKGIKEVAVVVDAFTPEQVQHGLNPIEIAAWIAKTLEGNNCSDKYLRV